MNSVESYYEKCLDGSEEEGIYGVCGHPDPVGVPNVHYSTRREQVPVIVNIDRKVILKRRKAAKVAKTSRKRNRGSKR